MGLFNRKNKQKNIEAKSVERYDGPIDRSNWQQVFSSCLGKMMAVQNACSELVVRGQDWNVDFGKGVISFGDLEYPLQFLGSESSSNGTWLWGWDNVNGFDGSIIAMAERTRQLGESWGLEPFTAAKFELTDSLNGHNLAIAACGISEEKMCYYRGPHAGGAVLVAFSGVPEEVFSPVDDIKFSTICMQCIQQFPVDHKIFIESFLRWNETQFIWEDNCIIARFRQYLRIEFEEADGMLRISSMRTCDSDSLKNKDSSWSVYVFNDGK